MLRLCDKSGWSYSFSKPNCGSIMKISWNNDGTSLAGAGGNGSVIFGNIVDKQLSWSNIDITLDEDNKITVNDCLHELNEELHFRDRVVNMELGYSHLIVCTTTQCYIYNTMNWTSPFVIDIKDNINLIVQGAKYFALIDAAQNFNVYNYEGRLMSTPKYSGLRVDFLTKRSISISADVIAIIDTSNTKIIRLFDAMSGKAQTVQVVRFLR
jgi:intraflagellar transport protein 80